MAQLHYGYATPSNVPGGIADISPRVIVSRINAEEETGIPLGVGVVVGKTAGENIKLPDVASTESVFEGVVVNGGLIPVGENGKVLIRKGAACNVMTAGKVWVRCAVAAEPAYGETAYLVTDGAEKGYFTVADDTGNTSKVELHGVRYLGGKDNNIAQVEITAARVVTTTPTV